MRVTRRRGTIRIQLEDVESQLLDGLLDDLDNALTTLPADDPVRQRLFPSGYRDDPRAEAEFRSLTESSLRESKSERVGVCRAQLPTRGGTVELDEEAAERWLTVLNDVRLGIGTRLDVREDDDPVVDATDPQAQSRVIYHWLTALQDSIVHAAMRG
jgi:Domain of unknown function (DUF2017)